MERIERLYLIVFFFFVFFGRGAQRPQEDTSAFVLFLFFWGRKATLSFWKDLSLLLSLPSLCRVPEPLLSLSDAVLLLIRYSYYSIYLEGEKAKNVS